jgi:hypothetical protein
MKETEILRLIAAKKVKNTFKICNKCGRAKIDEALGNPHECKSRERRANAATYPRDNVMYEFKGKYRFNGKWLTMEEMREIASYYLSGAK